MSIAVDQSRLRRIAHDILGATPLERNEALAIMEIAQLAAGVSGDDELVEHETLQAIAQHVGAFVGWKPGELCGIPRGSVAIGDEWLDAMAGQLRTRGARELAYVYAFLVSVSDLELTASEVAELERYQRALGLDDRCATDLVIRLTEVVASNQAPAAPQ
jgi:hypothetical protein